VARYCVLIDGSKCVWHRLHRVCRPAFLRLLAGSSGMSHQPSPAPSVSALPGPSAPSGRARASAKQSLPAGVAAQEEDSKYEKKYKELKKTVKAIELVRISSEYSRARADTVGCARRAGE
jgi:hypothetical protein